MNLEHIAISVNSKDEITDFYQNILGMIQVRDFVIDKNLAFDIFGISADVPVYLLNKESLTLEIFVTEQENPKGFNHICFSVQDRNQVFKNAQEKAYKCILIKRDVNDIMFINDKAGNVFEIKNK